jgi:hypothetical protein
MMYMKIHRHIYTHNSVDIKMDVREVGWGAWTGAQDRDKWRAILNKAMNLHVLQYEENFLSSLGRVSFSGRNLLHGVS